LNRKIDLNTEKKIKYWKERNLRSDLPWQAE